MTAESRAQDDIASDDPWQGFTPGPWRIAADVRDFLLSNNTPMTWTPSRPATSSRATRSSACTAAIGDLVAQLAAQTRVRASEAVGSPLRPGPGGGHE